MSHQNLDGQFHQATYVERLLRLNNRSRDQARKATLTMRNSERKLTERVVMPRLSFKPKLEKKVCSRITYSELLLHLYLNDETVPVRGFFIEAGAGDGEVISNSLYFELKYKWTGLLVEPNPDFYDALLSKQRNAWILPHCLSTKTTPMIVNFLANLHIGGIIHEETEEYPNNDTSHGITSRLIRVQCFPLYSVLKAIGNPKVDYFSLDIEGSELQVLKTMPWNKINMHVLGIESEHGEIVTGPPEDDIEKYLYSVGYRYLQKLGHDLFFKKTENYTA